MPSKQKPANTEHEALHNVVFTRGLNMNPLEEIAGTIPWNTVLCTSCSMPVGNRARGVTICSACAQAQGKLYEAADNRATLAITIDRLGRELHALKFFLLSIFTTPKQCPTCEQRFSLDALFAWSIKAEILAGGRAQLAASETAWQHNCAAQIIAQVTYGS